MPKTLGKIALLCMSQHPAGLLGVEGVCKQGMSSPPSVS